MSQHDFSDFRSLSSTKKQFKNTAKIIEVYYISSY